MINTIVEYAGLLWLETSNPDVDIYLNHGDKKYILLKPWLELVLNVEIDLAYLNKDKSALIILVSSSQIKLNDLNSIFTDLNNVIIGCCEDGEHELNITITVNLKET